MATSQELIEIWHFREQQEIRLIDESGGIAAGDGASFGVERASHPVYERHKQLIEVRLVGTHERSERSTRLSADSG